MKPNEIMKLIDAGFTAEEIRSMVSEQETAKPAASAETSETQPEPEKKTVPETQPETKKQPEDAKSDRILEAIDKLTGTITTFMITSTGRVTPEQEATVDEILGKILYPDGEEV